MAEIQPQNHRCSHKRNLCSLKKKQPNIFKVGINFSGVKKSQRLHKGNFRVYLLQ